MTELLQQVISEIQKLPADQQDAIASRLMAELKDEQWDRLADKVRQEIAKGETAPLDEAFPLKP